MTCRCTCKAYGGSCDCRYDGLTQGRQRSEDETVAKIAAWLRAPTSAGTVPLLCDVADELEAGAWR